MDLSNRQDKAGGGCSLRDLEGCSHPLGAPGVMELISPAAHGPCAPPAVRGPAIRTAAVGLASVATPKKETLLYFPRVFYL